MVSLFEIIIVLDGKIDSMSESLRVFSGIEDDSFDELHDKLHISFFIPNLMEIANLDDAEKCITP